jgi:hypothetical protein
MWPPPVNGIIPLQQGTGISIPRVGKMIVVTADIELQARCRRASKIEFLHILNPQTFLGVFGMAVKTATRTGDDERGKQQ